METRCLLRAEWNLPGSQETVGPCGDAVAGCWPAWEGKETSVANTDASGEILGVQLLWKTG